MIAIVGNESSLGDWSQQNRRVGIELCGRVDEGGGGVFGHQVEVKRYILLIDTSGGPDADEDGSEAKSD